MQKSLLSLSLLVMPLMAMSQSFSDDFESYTAGAKLAQSSSTWATWSGAGGGTDDIAVSNAKAHGGTKSVYFASTLSSGGPADIVLPLGGTYTSGTFTYSMWMFVETGKLAYFNFQESPTNGQAWALDVNFTAAGAINFNSSIDGAVLTTAYTQNQWFQLEMKIDLTTNTWEVLIDGVSKGKFSNSHVQIAGLDIFPTNNCGFYIDDVAYSYATYTVPSLNGTLSGIGNVVGYLAGAATIPTVQLKNIGNTTITSATVELTYDGITQTKDVSGLSLAYKGTTSISLDQPITLKAGSSQIIARVTKVNTLTDDVTGDNERTMDLNPIVPAKGKLVIGEEATGTWCQWCPRGAVTFHNMDLKHHGFFQGIAVHNNDPMMYSNYDKGLANIISGYPTAVIDRGAYIDPANSEADFLQRIVLPPLAVLRAGAVFDKSSRNLQVSLTTRFVGAMSGNYKIACALTEDSVTGTTSAYNQSNVYSGGSKGPMGGFENLPNPVPASKMVYDHVARMISPAFTGLPNAFGSSKAVGDSVVYNFTFSIPSEWNTSRMHIIGLFIEPSGKIDNATASTITEAEQHGFESGTEVLGTHRLNGPDASIRVYPNPSASVFMVHAMSGGSHQVKVTSLTGQIVFEGSFDGQMSIDASQWASGLYVLQVSDPGGSHSVRIVKE